MIKDLIAKKRAQRAKEQQDMQEAQSRADKEFQRAAGKHLMEWAGDYWPELQKFLTTPDPETKYQFGYMQSLEYIFDATNIELAPFSVFVFDGEMSLFCAVAGTDEIPHNYQTVEDTIINAADQYPEYKETR